MEITLYGTLEEIDAFVLRYRIPSKNVRDDSLVTPSPTVPENIFTIPKFTWDKSLEKSYRNMFFYEADDGKVMLSYFSSKVFTTKENVMQIPYPLVDGFEPLRKFNPNQRCALRFYRQYLAEQESLPKYVEKSTQDRIKENFELKERAKENQKEMSPKTKKLHDEIAMKIKMGI